ncbi:hypothetical protein [Enterococcus crotali]|uniref:hypothetical protein n=1 Tax=Enterococcus crotali TaxID=1453587 RepID=UPI0004A7FFBA|nr:hypothetical protein [Enterococcus crotali]OTP50024.1 hypothetical protein A5881_001439 [Enterococcus termitis]
MRKCIVGLFFLLMVGGLLISKPAEAVVKSDLTDVGIVFETDTTPEEPFDKLPDTNVPYIPKPISNANGKLPSMGELVTSLIWTFIGCSILILFVGIFSLRNIMLKIV